MSRSVAVAGLGVASAYGRGPAALIGGVLSGKPAFSPVTRFDVSKRRSKVAATLPGMPDLFTELSEVISAAGAPAGAPLYLAIHSDAAIARNQSPEHFSGAFGARLAKMCGLTLERVYTSACVAGSTALADAAAAISLGDSPAIVVAGGYLVEQDQFALFDAGRALANDGEVRPFSLGRKGIVMGDGVAAIVLAATCESPLAYVSGWGRAGDGFHVCQPIPDGTGFARAITAALNRAGIAPRELGYVNAHGSGSLASDPAESNGLRLALGDFAGTVPVSSTKSLHGQSLEASPLVEVVTTILALQEGLLPVNAGFQAPDPECPLNLILDEPLPAKAQHALSLNSAFGGANTALIVSRP